MGFGIKKDVTSNVTPSTIVFFDKATPTEVGVVFDPNTPATTNILYISSVDASTWIWDGSDYVTYAAPSVSSTEWYLYGTTIDAGSNKTASIQRSGAIFVNVDSYFYDVRVGRGSGGRSTNTIVGDKCLQSNTTGIKITAVGAGALQINTASDNTAVGWGSLNSNTTGSSNVAIGSGALLSNSTGFESVAIGFGALNANNGNLNVSVGFESLNKNTSGGGNTAIGYHSLYHNLSGSNNSGVGYQAGKFLANGSTSNTTGFNSVFIGVNTRALSANNQNQIVIGYDVTGQGSNTVQLGNTSITNTYLQGAVTFNNAYTLPTTDGTANYFLKTNGSGVVTWASGGSSGIVGIANSSGVYTYYTTLSAAMTAAVSGQTVDLLTDITETGSVTITTKEGVKINGNGYTYTLSVNDATHAITTGSALIELFNIKVVRTGRANNSTGVVISKTSTVSLCTLKCQNVVFENTYGIAVVMYLSAIYGLTVNSYGTGIDTGNSAGNIYNCIVTSTAGIGIYNNDTSEIANCNVTGATNAISSRFCYVYNTMAKSTSGTCILATRVVNSTGISSSGTAINSYLGYNCVGISTSGVALAGGDFTNSTGISTSGYAASGGTKTNCTLISSSNYASFQENLNNCYLESTTNVPLWTSSSKLINSCTSICLWNNAGGHAINTTSASTGVDIRNCNLTVTNASAYCINGASASTFKYASNTFKGSTTAVNTTNITQGITNTEDNQGNILI